MNSPASIEAAREAHKAAGARLASWALPTLRLVGTALVLALGIRILVVQPFAIPSRSMSPGLEAGDFVFVDKRAYGWTTASLPLVRHDDGTTYARFGAKAVRPGEVIAFVGPDGRDYVKRMVAGGGDRVELRRGLLIVNGLPAPCVPAGDGMCRETLANGQQHLVRSNGSSLLADFPETLVPQGQYFVLGDNRDASADSRVPRALGGVGLVSDGEVIGRASRIFFSSGGPATGGVRWDRIGKRIE